MSVRIPLGGLAALSTLLLAACGGGGGGSESSTPPVQTATALAVSASNYTTVAQQSVSSSLYLLDSAESVLGAQSAGLNAPLRYALAQTERLAAWFAKAPRSVAGATQSYSEACAGGGRIDLVLTDVNGNGQLDANDGVELTAVSCVEDGVTLNGTLDMTLTAVTGSFGAVSYSGSVRLRLSNFSSQTATASATGNGEMTVDLSVNSATSSSATLTVPAFTLSGQSGGVSYNSSLSNYRLSVVKAPTTASYTVAVSVSGDLSGSLLESKQISLSTPTPLLRNATDTDPSSGQLLVRGAAGSQVRISAQAGGVALIELDADGNGSYELSTTRSWSQLR